VSNRKKFEKKANIIVQCSAFIGQRKMGKGNLKKQACPERSRMEPKTGLWPEIRSTKFEIRNELKGNV